MTDRDSIVRKLAAMQAKAKDGASTPNEVETAIRMMDALMQKHNLTLDDIQIKNSGVNAAKFAEKTSHEIFYCATSIATLTETRVLYFKQTKEYIYYGIGADVQYAEWLYRLIYNSIEQSWKAFRYSAAYTKLVKYEKIHGRVVRSNFRKAFAYTIKDALDKMAAEHKRPTGNALLVLKQQLVAQDLEGIKINKSSKQMTVNVLAQAAIRAGISEAEKVRLRQEADHQETLLLEGN